MSKSARTPTAGAGQPVPRSVKLFISYSHRNKVWMKRLHPLLTGFQYDDRMQKHSLTCLHAWHDKELTSGNQWDGEIKQKLEEMHIFVPLVSADFFASSYIQNVELPLAKQRHKNGEILVVPILLYDTNLREKCAFLHGFSMFPTTGRWWSSYKDRNDAHRLIDDGLWAAINEVIKRTSQTGP